MRCLLPLLCVVACGSVSSTNDAGVDPDAAPDGALDDAPVAQNLVFVTSSVHDGALGGLAGADDACNARASEAGLPGTYVAWLSTTSADARDRLATARGWVRPDGQPFADTLDELLEGAVLYPARLDEGGNDLGAVSVWTATTPAGELETADSTCDDWTSATPDLEARQGLSNGGGPAWTRSLASETCDQLAHLLCFGIDHDEPVEVEPVEGRLAFLGPVQLLSTSGVAGFDAQCQQTANDAGVGGTFAAAVVATANTAVTARFDLGGAPWVRPDGVAILSTAADLATASLFDAPLAQRLDGSYIGVDVFVGATTFGEASGENCANWSDASLTFIQHHSDGRGPASANCGRPDLMGGFDALSSFVFCFEQ